MHSLARFLPCFCLLALAACGGGGADANIHTTTVSKGQELMDLQKARESGAIDEDDYQDQKAAILER